MARRRSSRLLPGFGLTMGITLVWVALLVLVPLVALVARSTNLGPERFVAVLGDPRAIAAFALSFGTSAAAALFDTIAGLLVAWVLVRYRFPGRAIADAMVDLPFALPTAVSGIALTALYAERGAFGQPLATLGIKVAFTPIGITLALAFIGLPFVVRTVEPVLEALESEIEEAAWSLGATRAQTFRHVILPALRPALVTGFALAFARAIGEYGSVVFIAGNMPFKTEIAPLLIVTKLEQYDYGAATAVASVMLAASFGLLLGLGLLEQRRRAAAKHAEVSHAP